MVLGTGISPGALGARVVHNKGCAFVPNSKQKSLRESNTWRKDSECSLHPSVYTRVVHPPGFREDAVDIAVLLAAGISAIFCEALSASSAAPNVMAATWDWQIVQAQHSSWHPDQHRYSSSAVCKIPIAVHKSNIGTRQSCYPV